MYSSVRTDLSLEDIALLGCVGPQINRGAIQTLLVDGQMVDRQTLADGAQVLIPRPDAIRPVLQTFSTGE
jgi:hypothetical protein